MIDTAVGYTLTPVDQLDLGAGRYALEEKLAVGRGGLSLELEYVGDLLDLPGLDHLPVERKLVSPRHAIVGPRRAAWPRAIGGDNQPQLDTANGVALVIDELA